MRAKRCLENIPDIQSRPALYLFLALGSKARDESASRQAFQTALARDRSAASGTSGTISAQCGDALADRRVDRPWLSCPRSSARDVSSRLPAGNPRQLQNGSPAYLILNLARYDRDVAGALFESSGARMSPPGDDVTAPSPDGSEDWLWFWSWSIFDPRAAVARLETLPIDPKLPTNQSVRRLAVAKSLAQDHEHAGTKSGAAAGASSWVARNAIFDKDPTDG